ncbi:MAG: helix-turn-helix domain-containing protein [Chloroflexi bacterium]|nr:helix-turn-helix domain-containing protein [Chloroflexota bacterium]MBU1752186.1 helix-turn-helix domain-containing protein [Chloroflexota bacterium]
MMKPTALGTLVKQRRVELGLPQSALARACCVNPSYIAQLERGHIRLPSPAIIKTLAVHLTDIEREIYTFPEDLLVAAGYLTPDEAWSDPLGPQKRLLLQQLQQFSDWERALIVDFFRFFILTIRTMEVT